jgi:hypothetical protein
MMTRWVQFCLLSALAFWLMAFAALGHTGPRPVAGGGALSVPDTGLAGIYTGQVRVSDHPHHVLMGHVIVVRRGEALVRALVIQQRRDGVHRLRFREAWSGGIALPYRSGWRGSGCTHGHCRDNPVGMIFLSAALFERVQGSGLSARLIGGTGAMQITVPARIFADAAARARAAGLIAPAPAQGDAAR